MKSGFYDTVTFCQLQLESKFQITSIHILHHQNQFSNFLVKPWSTYPVLLAVFLGRTLRSFQSAQVDPRRVAYHQEPNATATGLQSHRSCSSPADLYLYVQEGSRLHVLQCRRAFALGAALQYLDRIIPMIIPIINPDCP